MTEQAQIFMVDDHPVFRLGLRRILESESDLSVCGEVDRLEGAVQAISDKSPSLVLIDITLRDGHGLELVRQLKADKPTLPTLVVSMHDEKLYAERAVRAGAQGYLSKHASAEKIIDSVRQAIAGELVLSPDIARNLLRRTLHRRPTEASPLAGLSDRELEIFEMIGRGDSARTIAEKLNISVKTVETHRTNIRQKINLSSTNELVRFATTWVADGEYQPAPPTPAAPPPD
ncbi:MAG: response regulator transcription factor [Myxococcota bacterium]